MKATSYCCGNWKRELTLYTIYGLSNKFVLLSKTSVHEGNNVYVSNL